MRFFIWFSSFILMICTAFLIFFLSQPTRSSSRAYLKLKTEIEEEQSQSLSAQQNRSGVRKDYYLFKGESCVNYLLKATHSSLFLKNEEGCVHIVEIMENLKGWEWNSGAPLRVRYAEAKRGVYNYNKETLLASEVIFKHDTLNEESILEGSIEEAFCCLKNTEAGKNVKGKATEIRLPGDFQLNSQRSRWDPTHQSLSFDKTDQARPRISSSSSALEADQLLISHNDLGWMVVAKGNVSGKIDALAQIQAQQTVSIQIQKIEGLWKFSSLIAEGPVQLDMISSNQQFISNGLLTLNHQKGELIAQSVGMSDKQTQLTNQIFFKDPFCSGYTNTFQLNYDPLTSKVKKVWLKGQVRIRNVFNTNVLDQHAIADEVSFDPAEKIMHLRAFNGSKVLFLDSANCMQMSARALDVIYDKGLKTPVVKGIGDVHLIFGEEELNKMRRWVDFN